MEKGLKINARFAGEGSEGSARRKRAGSKGSEGCGVAGATVLYAASRQGVMENMQTGLRLWEIHPYPPPGTSPGGGSLRYSYRLCHVAPLPSVHSPTGYAGVASEHDS